MIQSILMGLVFLVSFGAFAEAGPQEIDNMRAFWGNSAVKAIAENAAMESNMPLKNCQIINRSEPELSQVVGLISCNNTQDEYGVFVEIKGVVYGNSKGGWSFFIESVSYQRAG